jgi:hypothetical protein
MHTYRRGGESRPRILYWFRTPPHVKVGRAPLDEEAIRTVEANHPDLAFDWPKILQSQTTETEPAAQRRPARSEPETAHAQAFVSFEADPGAEAVPGSRQSGRKKRRKAGQRETPGRSSTDPPGRFETSQAESEEPAPADSFGQESSESVPVEAVEEAPAVVHPVFEEEANSVTPIQTAAERMLASEQLGRLRALYSEIQARITDRQASKPDLDRIKAEAERLNPGSWVTPEEVASGLEQFDELYAGLRAALGRRRKRSRRGGIRRRHRRIAELPEGPSLASGSEIGQAADTDELSSASGLASCEAGDESKD